MLTRLDFKKRNARRLVGGTILTTVAEKMHSDFTTWLTILESIPTSGRRLTPCVVFSGGAVQGHWFPEVISRLDIHCNTFRLV
jgi:hypothetical protein